MNTVRYSVYLLVVTLVFTFIGFTVYRSVALYQFVKYGEQFWVDPYGYDSLLGWKPRPNHRSGFYLYGELHRVTFDEYGLRTIEDGNHKYSDRSLLSLGDSWTLGAQVDADETYTAIAARQIQATPLNAGVSAYGLAQMLLSAKLLIPALKPDYLVVQYSPWLVTRAVKQFADTAHGFRPNPFFVELTNGAFVVHPPVFDSKHLFPKLSDFRESNVGLADFVVFYFKVGGPLFFRNHYEYLLFRVKSALNVYSKPASDRERLIVHVYSSIAKLARSNGSAMFILMLGRNRHIDEDKSLLSKVKGATVVDGVTAMYTHLEADSIDDWLRQFAHLRGFPPKVVNKHPNMHAHRIIGVTLADAIDGLASQSSPLTLE